MENLSIGDWVRYVVDNGSISRFCLFLWKMISPDVLDSIRRVLMANGLSCSSWISQFPSFQVRKCEADCGQRNPKHSKTMQLISQNAIIYSFFKDKMKRFELIDLACMLDQHCWRTWHTNTPVSVEVPVGQFETLGGCLFQAFASIHI